MRLIITRHGETEENKAGILQGHMEGVLSQKGIEQAKKVALRLKDEGIDCIYSSDLKRAANTAKEIAKYHSDIPLEFTQELREMFLGEWQGKRKKDLGINKCVSVSSLSPKNGETIEKLFDRAKKFLTELLEKYTNETILLVGHNGIDNALIAVILGKTHEDIKAMESLRNTGISIFEFNKESESTIEIFNSASHLE